MSKRKLSTLVGSVKLPIVKDVNYGNENYNYCLAEIHGTGYNSKIIRLYFWNASMKNVMNERIIINWNSPIKKQLSRIDINRLKIASKVYANQTK